ncbi:Phage major capsid protein, HK97 family OS=Bosea thiooxidans OX=53254 GN=SAMN05660750_04081 PE=4 SV=1 [Bosea thiooxidans]
MSDIVIEKIAALGKAFETQAGALNTRLGELEKKYAREEGHEGGEPIGNALENAISTSDAIRDLSSSFRGKAVVKLTGERADITSGNTTAGAGRSAGTSLVPGHRVAGIIEPYQRVLRVRDVIGTARTTSSSVEYVKETSFTNNAAPVAETTLKPKSDLTFDMYNSPVRTIAHIFKISRQMLDDGPALASYIARRGTYGLKRVEEAQLLNGDGTGQNSTRHYPAGDGFRPRLDGDRRDSD